MNNVEALAALAAQRAAINQAINALHRYIQERDAWQVDVATAQMAEVKRLGSSGGVDLASWDGTTP